MKHERYMQRCIELALNGKGNVSPNPMVGAVVVYNDQIIGEGFHEKAGEVHAEVNAINSVENKNLLKDSILYVSLEPCNHYGKTPPCSDLIVENKIPRVVIGCIDPFEKVAGKGIEKLMKSGIDVTLGILEKECINLNKRFFTFFNKRRPYIILKWARSIDGFMDISRKENENGIHWITQPETKQLTHQWRAAEDAILAGTNTIKIDNPSLTVREVGGRNPIRLVIDKNLSLDSNLAIFNEKAETIVYNTLKEERVKNVSFVKADFESLIPFILRHLFEISVQSVIIEGGAYTLNQFISLDLWDEARELTGVTYLTEGKKAPSLNLIPSSEEFFGKDKLTIFQNA